MNYQAISTEKLKKSLKLNKIRLQWLKSPNRKHWSELWAQSEERKVEKEIRDIEDVLCSREAEKTWI